MDLDEKQRALEDREKTLVEREAAADRRDILNFVDELASGPNLRLPPVLKPLAVDCLLGASASPDAGTIEFSETEGGTPVKLSQRDGLKRLLSSLPNCVQFGEVAKGGDFVVDPPSTDPKAMAQQLTQLVEAGKAADLVEALSVWKQQEAAS